MFLNFVFFSSFLVYIYKWYQVISSLRKKIRCRKEGRKERDKKKAGDGGVKADTWSINIPKLGWIQGVNAVGAEADREIAMGKERVHERGFINWN